MKIKIISTFLAAVLVVSSFALAACKKTDENVDADTTVIETTSFETTALETTMPETEPETTIPETTVPETTAAETEPPIVEVEAEVPVYDTGDPNEYIGSVYTRGELNSMDRTLHGFGPGVNAGADMRPYGAINAQNTYGYLDAYYIAPADGNIYLTFDLGYENGYTGQILDTLNAKGVKGVFFATLSYCKQNPALVSRIINEGHTLGNHSVSHLSMPTLTVSQMQSEIMDMHYYIQNNYGYTMTLFRPPMGEFSVQSLAVTKSLGYKTVEWSFAYLDYDTANQPDHTFAYNRITSAAHSGAIYLLHAVSQTNTAILSDVIDYFRGAGYNLVAFS